ncbi:MAG: DUF3352 domain-containing protein [Patescibacteria group bacterium]
MSQFRKQQKKREHTIKKLTKLAAAFVIFGLLILGTVFFYQEFFAKKPPENFIPEFPTSFISVNFKRDPDQDEIIKKLGLRLGDENIFENTLKNIIFPNLNEEELDLTEEEKIKSWLGEKIGIGHIYISPQVGISIFILDLKNQDLAKKFLQRFSDNLGKRGNVIAKEAFRDAEITEISGQTQLAYAINSGYLLISSGSDGIKKMIDTRAGRFPSLAQSRDYYLTKKRVAAKSAIAVAYLDTMEFLKIIYQATSGQKNQQILDTMGALGQKRYLGLSITPQEDRIKILGFTKKESEKEFKFRKTKPFFDQKIPKDLIASFEGKDLKPILEGLLMGNQEGTKPEEIAKKELFFRAFELETGLNLENDLFSLFNSHYVFTLLPSSEKIEAGLITEIKNQPDVLKKLSKLEETATALLNKYVVKEENKKVNFTEHSFGKTNYRYLNLPDQYQIDISYAVLPDYLVLATSKETLEKLLAAITGTEEVLSNNPSYQNAVAQLSKKDSHQIIFIDGQNLLKFINRYIRFDYEKLDKKAKAIESLVINHEEKSTGSFFESFLKIK